jgi:hypothetical protein
MALTQPFVEQYVLRDFGPSYYAGAMLLLDASELAHKRGLDAWQTAIKLADFHRAGTPNTQLWRLLDIGFILAGMETGPAGKEPREFLLLPNSTINFPKRACFIGTDPGLAWAHQLKLQALRSSSDATESVFPHPHGINAAAPAVPFWDGDKRLWFLGLVVKEFSKHAWAQIMVLEAFQKSGWSSQVANPFTGPKALEQLENAVKKLNQRHVHPQLLRFFLTRGGDGAGWQLMEKPLRNPCGTRVELNRNEIGTGLGRALDSQFEV